MADTGMQTRAARVRVNPFNPFIVIPPLFWVLLFCFGGVVLDLHTIFSSASTRKAIYLREFLHALPRAGERNYGLALYRRGLFSSVFFYRRLKSRIGGRRG